MKTLPKISRLACVAILILVSGCATHRAAKTAKMDNQECTGPESSVKPADATKKTWSDYMEYAFMPVTVGSGLLLWYSNLPGVAK